MDAPISIHPCLVLAHVSQLFMHPVIQACTPTEHKYRTMYRTYFSISHAASSIVPYPFHVVPCHNHAMLKCRLAEAFIDDALMSRRSYKLFDRERSSADGSSTWHWRLRLAKNHSVAHFKFFVIMRTSQISMKLIVDRFLCRVHMDQAGLSQDRAWGRGMVAGAGLWDIRFSDNVSL